MIEIIVYTAIISALVLFGLLCYGGWLYTERQHDIREATLEEIEKRVEGS